MAEEYTTIKVPKQGEVKYRVDADFVPKEKKQMCVEFIKNYCRANNEIEWLKTVVRDKDGKDKPIAEIRTAVWNKFFTKKKSPWEDIF